MQWGTRVGCDMTNGGQQCLWLLVVTCKVAHDPLPCNWAEQWQQRMHPLFSLCAQLHAVQLKFCKLALVK